MPADHPTSRILQPDDSRFVLFPIKFPALWKAYKDAQSSFWTAEEVHLGSDRDDWNTRLTTDERTFISVILAFFAASDGIVVENLAQRFCAEVQIPEARCFYGFQIMIENVHAEIYSRLLVELIPDLAEQTRLLNGLNTIPAVRAKGDWCLRWITNTDHDFAIRLIAFAIVEGIFFSSSFAAIFWLRSRRLMPGFAFSNELIARDEGMHTSFACLLFRHLSARVPAVDVYDMVDEAVKLEHAFFKAALPVPLIGMNVILMKDYVEYVADFLLEQLGYDAFYGKANPFPFMASTAANSHANFFERSVSDYVGAATAEGGAEEK
ncbi:putative ribonucleoside-diphosphate reductase small chain B [Earliella scabrosa]|nr:putative ribonucleoside-diphosphate reductase small chain B [Earliella scabrosa]